jgi:hypothetical protein
MNYFRNLFCLLFTLSCISSATANTAIRAWSYLDGKSFQAMIMDWNAESDIVKLSDDAGKMTEIKRSALSLSDQAYVRQWFDYRKKLDDKLKEMGGTMEYLQTTGASQTDYYVYKPSTFSADGTAPILVLFSSSGTGYRMMLRHFEAAEKTGFVLVTADYFSNHTLDFHNKHGLANESEGHFREMLPQLESISHDPQKLFMGGDSGGALRAYMYSAAFDRPWAGIYANGGWLGRDYTMQCRTNMRVAMVNGHKDLAAIQSAKKDLDYLVDKRECTVSLFSFEGGHQLATTDAQVEAFNWLLGKSEE